MLNEVDIEAVEELSYLEKIKALHLQLESSVHELRELARHQPVVLSELESYEVKRVAEQLRNLVHRLGSPIDTMLINSITAMRIRYEQSDRLYLVRRYKPKENSPITWADVNQENTYTYFPTDQNLIYAKDSLRIRNQQEAKSPSNASGDQAYFWQLWAYNHNNDTWNEIT
jgi:hypothetical protein